MYLIHLVMGQYAGKSVLLKEETHSKLLHCRSLLCACLLKNRRFYFPCLEVVRNFQVF
jgi:hypothetical protein